MKIPKKSRVKKALVWHEKGLAYSKLGKYDEAIKCYNKAIEIDPSARVRMSTFTFDFDNL